MGRNSKRRRDAKAAKRQQGHHRIGSRSSATGAQGMAGAVLDGILAETSSETIHHVLEAMLSDEPVDQLAADVWRGVDSVDPVRWRGALVNGVMSVWAREVRRAYGRGWWPHELPRVAERKVPKLGGQLTTDVISYLRVLDGEGDRAWSLDRLGPRTDPGKAGDIARRSARALGGTGEATLDWFVASLRALVPILCTRSGVVPPPSAQEAVDDAVLTKVRALLAQAESTTFAEEAETFAAKAQELITRHAIDEALLRGGTTVGDVPVLRRVPIDDPYFDAKALLLISVASANRCSCVMMSQVGCVAVVGFSKDLDLVELLFTSLLAHAVRGTARANKQVTGGRTRSYRKSFLVGFADRIGQRLRETDRSAVADAAADAGGGGLLPVLAARRGAVDDACTALFPNTTRLTISDPNRQGRYAGMAAADLVDLTLDDRLTKGDPMGEIEGAA